MSGKLKGIYDALDHGNYKNACKLCSTFLQKQPAHSLARALHAVALERCGRRDEAIHLSQETIAAGAGATSAAATYLDDTCLNTLQVVLRRCRQWNIIAEMFEAAWNREPDVEEYGSSLFLTHVRLQEFAKAQQVATKMYRKFSKAQYLLWVVATMLLQVRAGAAPKMLDLAAMMLQKAPINLDALKSESRVPFNRGQLYLFLLHLSTLQLQEKQAEALTMLEDGKALLKLPSDLSALRVQLLWEAGRHKEAAQEARAQVIASPGSWASAQDYARLVFKLAAPDGFEASRGHSARLRGPLPSVTSMDEVASETTQDEGWNALLLFRHLQQVEEQGCSTGGGSGVNRVAFMAELELRRCALAATELQQVESSEDLQELLGVIKTFIQRFAGRAHCFFDLKPHLAYLSEADALPILSVGIGQEREATVLQARLRRSLRRTELNEAASAERSAAEVSEARRLVEAWVSFGGGAEDSRSPEALLQLAVVALLEADRSSPSKAVHRGHLLDAIALAQLGLQDDKHAFGYKVLLLLLYNSLHLPTLMFKLYSTMDIKNIQHESLSYLVFDALGNHCPEQMREVCSKIQSFHEDLDKDGSDAVSGAFNMQGILCRVPEYVDSLAEVSRSLIWGKAVVEETAADLAVASSWEAFAESCGRQLRILSLVADQEVGHWALRNQDRLLLNGLQQLPKCKARETLVGQVEGDSPQPASLTSFGASWSCKRVETWSQKRGNGAAEELLHSASPAAQLAFVGSMLRVLGHLACKEGPAEDKLSSTVESARRAFAQLWNGDENKDLESSSASMAAALKSDDCSCWSKAASSFRRFCHACSLEACEIALLVLRCGSGAETWQKPAQRVEALSAAFASALQALQGPEQCSGEGAGDFAPPPRSQNDSQLRPFRVGSFGLPCLDSLLNSLLVLIPVAVWTSNTLPKSGSKKAKAGQEGLQACRTALKDFSQALNRATELQAAAAAAAKAEASELLQPSQSSIADAMSGAVLEKFGSLRREAEACIVEAQSKQLRNLADVLAQRSALLKSKGKS